MARITKIQTKYHEEACELVDSDKDLTLDERIFVFKNWNPMASHNVGKNAIFFTPFDLAKELQIETISKPGKKVLDLCAGIGVLAFWSWKYNEYEKERVKIVCLEHNPEFVRVGKRVLPEATWICKDAFDPTTFWGLGQFDEVISNPPYGISINGPGGFPSHFKAAEIAMGITNTATFILPQADLPFSYSEIQGFLRKNPRTYEKFNKKTGICFHMNCGIDTSFAKNDWRGVKPTVEIVNIDREKD